MRKSIFFILLLINYLALQAEITPRFSSLQTQTYIPYNNINDIREDALGFLWIGTENGLVKFNGYDYIQYQQNPSAPHSLPNNNCRTILLDSKQRLWIGTDNGIAIYNQQKDNFRAIALSELSSRNIVKLLEDKNGRIWAQSFNELIKLDDEGNLLRSFPLLNGVCMEMDEDQIWLGSIANGLFLFDLRTECMQPVDIAQLPKEQTFIRSLHKGSDGSLFIGTAGTGFYIFHPETNQVERYSSTSLPNIFKSDYILDIYEDKEHQNIWIGSVNGQLVTYNLHTHRFSIPEFKYPSSVDFMTVGCIREDSQNNIWIGTHHYWLFQSNNSSKGFELYQHKSQPSLSHNSVTCFAESSQSVLIGTDGGGLNILDKRTNSFRSDPRFGKIILDIKNGKQPNEYWIATWGNSKTGVVRYNTATNAIQNFVHSPNDPNSITSNSLRCLLVEDDFVWVATDGGGLCRIHAQSGKIDNRNNCKDPLFSQSMPQWVNHLLKDQKGRLWICSSEGLLLYENGQCRRLQIGMQDESQLQNEVKMAMETSDGTICIATANNGLLQYNEQTGTFSNLSSDFHLPSKLSSVCQDKEGNIWLSSEDKVTRFNTQDHSSEDYNLKNDLNGNPFTPNAILVGSEKIFIGSNNGFFAFQPNKLHAQNRTHKVLLKDLYIWGERQIAADSSALKHVLAFSDTITLSHNQSSFSIDFFAIDYEDPYNIRYEYFLEGLHQEWVDAGNTRQAYFTNLSPGTYQFQVRASHGEQASLSRPITIIILPPWWGTWWFRITIIGSLLLLLYTLFRQREKSMIERQNMLEKTVAERTEELRHKSNEIQQQKESLELQNKRLDESLATKDKILSVIAHDLRNPLTAIIGNLTLLSDEENNPRIKQTCKSAKDLQNQMENLLDWARLQNQSILYSPKECFLDAMSKECITLLQGLFTEKQISISLSNSAHTSAFVDQRMISTVCRNLMNNAIKFTHEGGAIQVAIEEDDQHIIWSIRDNGVGMSQEQCDKLFCKEYTSTTFGTKNEKGSGLGLKICKEFISLNKGELTISSKQGEGTTIRIALPKGSLKQEEKENSSLMYEQHYETNQQTDKKILIVDDNTEILSFLNDLLRTTYEVSTANNGEDALKIAQKELPDLIISDVVMPKMNGREFCYHIKRETLTKHIPVVLLTSEDTIDDQVQGLNIGADDYITKPFNAEILKAKIATILKNKELQREHLRTRILKMPEMEIPESADDTFIHKINEVIKANIHDSNLTVEFLADKTAFSRVQLFRKMKAITGCSPSEYIKAVRLEYAAEILKESKQTIAEVAYSVGFSDPKYFSSCFSEKFGVTPSVFSKGEK